jgi:CRP-like cAMP-binding protein
VHHGISTGNGRPGRAPTQSDDGLALAAAPFAESHAGTYPKRLLTERQRLHLISIASRIRLSARASVYAEATPAIWIYIVESGLVKTFRHLPSGRRCVTAFLFSHDLFGLAQNGVYVNSARTVTPAVLYRIRVDTLTESLRRDGDLQLKFLYKVTHELREAQRRAVLLARRDAAGRLAMFLNDLRKRTPHGEADRIEVPMSRGDIADHIGLTAEAVSRAIRKLRQEQILTFEGSRTARVLDRRRFAHLVDAV